MLLSLATALVCVGILAIALESYRSACLFFALAVFCTTQL
jgi:hypothetical protein